MPDLPPYTFFANVYDFVMQHVNFELWSRYILNSFPSAKVSSVLDLGCGTGTLLSYFPNHWKKVGIDRSKAMLELAKHKNPSSHFFHGDISNFTLDEKFDLIVCTHDAANYLLTLEELKSFFHCVRRHLNLEGHFFFDLNSEYNLKYVFHKKTIRKVIKNIFIDWTNEYDEQKKIIYSTLVFRENENTWIEKHLQKYHSPSDVLELLKEQGFEVLKTGSDYETWTVTSETYLITFLARPCVDLSVKN